MCVFVSTKLLKSLDFSQVDIPNFVWWVWDSKDAEITGEHYAKWNKPGGERQTPYDLTYKWNLINKKNKQAKYNQRHGN